MFMVAACGVVGNKFFPDATGPITQASLMGLSDKAVSVLAPHADNLLFIKGINFPLGWTDQLRPRAGPLSVADRGTARRQRLDVLFDGHLGGHGDRARR